MIERTLVEGKMATVTYLKNHFKPGTKEDHDFVKVIWDDGRVVFAYRGKTK